MKFLVLLLALLALFNCYTLPNNFEEISGTALTSLLQVPTFNQGLNMCQTSYINAGGAPNPIITKLVGRQVVSQSVTAYYVALLGTSGVKQYVFKVTQY